MDIEILKKLKAASKKNISIETRNQVLLRIAEELEKSDAFEANKRDLENAKILLEEGKISNSVYQRLELTENKFKSMIDGLKDLVKLEDPVNKVLLRRKLDDDLTLYKVSCPIGVLAVIFEARPDVIVQVAGLAIKSSNALILKGGKEVRETNTAIFSAIMKAIKSVKDFPQDMIYQIYTRDEVTQLLNSDEYIDLIIPRGGKNLVKYIKENTKIPVMGHADGICHIFVDSFADFEKAKRIIIDAKCQYPSACNSVETVLIHNDFSQKQELIKALEDVNIKINTSPTSWQHEYGSLELSLKIVDNVDDAITHINTYGSGHTDAIVTENKTNAEKFLSQVDSAGVYHNASTRFADGYRYGFGAEVGIATGKIHARGPVGLDGLTIYKYKLIGSGNIVKDYVDNIKTFKHVDF